MTFYHTYLSVVISEAISDIIENKKFNFFKKLSYTDQVHALPRRDGDLPDFRASADKARDIPGWKVRCSLDAMCLDTWHWQKQNPNGCRQCLFNA